MPMHVFEALMTAAAVAGSIYSASAGSSPKPFQLRVLAGGFDTLKLGYAREQAFAQLRAAKPEDARVVLGEDDIERYDWATQRIRLTADASKRLVAALPRGRADGAAALMDLEKRLGWGNPVERGLYNQAFVVCLGDEWLYGGIFLDPPSQMAIGYPVIRCAVEQGRVVLSVLPVHLPFFATDPVADDGAPAQSAVTREHGPVREVPSAMMDHFAQQARAEPVCALRALVRDARVREVFARAGKLGG